MSLGEGADPARHLIEPEEQTLERVAELPLDERPRLRQGEWLHRDRHPLQLERHVRRQKVPPRREEASQLGESRTELLEGETEPRSHPSRIHPFATGDE